ncbi:hypothetical protein SEA_ZOOMAN_249 [Microbacterium phage Zooman]|nr:hypothetical protein SEA_ZOOMAN_249 [Microbacterium phage Zooman]
MNFKTRYLVETINTAGEREFALATNDSASADAVEADLLGRGISVIVTDRALQHRPGTAKGAYDRGYHGLRIRTGVHTLSYIQGKIDRSADVALDDLDDLVEQKSVDFENRHRNSWVAADQSRILWTGLGKVAA